MSSLYIPDLIDWYSLSPFLSRHPLKLNETQMQDQKLASFWVRLPSQSIL